MNVLIGIAYIVICILVFRWMLRRQKDGDFIDYALPAIFIGTFAFMIYGIYLILEGL